MEHDSHSLSKTSELAFLNVGTVSVVIYPIHVPSTVKVAAVVEIAGNPRYGGVVVICESCKL